MSIEYSNQLDLHTKGNRTSVEDTAMNKAELKLSAVFLPRDILEAAQFEYSVFGKEGLRAHDFTQLRDKGIHIKSAMYKDQYIGHVLFCVRKNTLDILKIAVHSKFRLKGVGSCLIGALVVECKKSKRARFIRAAIHDDYLEVGDFFLRNGFEFNNSMTKDNNFVVILHREIVDSKQLQLVEK